MIAAFLAENKAVISRNASVLRRLAANIHSNHRKCALNERGLNESCFPRLILLGRCLCGSVAEYPDFPFGAIVCLKQPHGLGHIISLKAPG